MTSINKATSLTIERQSLVGIDKYLQAMASFMVNGISYTPSQLKAAIQADIDATLATQTARATLGVAVQKEREVHATAHGILLALKSFLINQYGKNAAVVLADFGFTAPKLPKTDPATKVAAAAKALATRKARGTLGKVQRKAIKGVVIDPHAAPAATPVAVTASTGSAAAPAVTPTLATVPTVTK